MLESTRGVDRLPHKLFSALSSDRRRTIVELLAERARRPKELSGRLNISSPAVSRHLRILGRAGVVSRTATGHGVLYSLASERLTEGVGGYLNRIAVRGGLTHAQ